MEINSISNDKFILFFLGLALILLIIYNRPEHYLLIITGLLGFIGVNKVNQAKVEEVIETTIQKNSPKEECELGE